MSAVAEIRHKSIDELNAARAHVLAAPKDNAAIDRLCYRPGFGERVYPDQLTLSVADGVAGDRWKAYPWMTLADGSADPRIQVCILPKRVLDLVWSPDSDVAYPGDTMIVDMDLSDANLPTGTRLKIGSAVIEVSDVRNDGCTKWAARYGQQTRDWINLPENIPLRLRGVLCRVVEDGTVRLDDCVMKV